jgi:hypothetical protein
MPHQSMATETEQREQDDVEATMDGGLCRLDLPGPQPEEEEPELRPPGLAPVPPRRPRRTGP